MRSNRWSPRRWLGFALVLGLAWLPTACGNKNGENASVNVPNEETTTGGVTGLGLPAGGTTTGTSGSSSTTTTTTGATTGAPSPTPGGTGTTGGAAAPSPANVTTTDMLSSTDNNQLKPTTRMESIQGQIAVNQGFSLGVAQGQILLVDPNAVRGTPTPLIMRSLPSSAFNETLTNPWDLSSDGSQNLIVTDGIGISGQPGRVIRVSNITITPSTNSTVGSANATFSLATSGNTTPIFNPLFVEPIGGGIIFVTEYIASPMGSVRRIDLATGNVTTVINGLNFPAGLAADLTNGFLYVCQNAAANGGPNGSVIRVSLAAINNVANGTIAPISPNDVNNVAVITSATGQSAFNRPWECKLDSAGGLITAEGNALGSVVQGAPGPGGLAQGAIRYVPRNTTVANAILTGLNNCAGLTFQGTAGSTNLIFFVEAATNPNGMVRSLQFNTTTLLVPTGGSLSYGTGFNSPIDTLPATSSNGLPLKAAINFFGGAGNQGRVVDFR